MGEWIPVKGGHWPEKGQEVIATMDFSVQVGKPDLCVTMCRFNGNSEQVTRMKAWMPSPEPYKEEE